MDKYFGKIRPQIFLALIALSVIAVLAITEGITEISVGCIAGIIALSKDVLQSDSNNNNDGAG
jgi:hypothetical protein